MIIGLFTWGKLALGTVVGLRDLALMVVFKDSFPRGRF